jgi:NTP pyrophosphatase (non-canonical NTP hydrolase)
MQQTLTFNELVEANLSRVVRWHPGGLHEWSPLEWAGAMAGEAGEACNAAKKLKRIDGQLANINREEGRSLTDRRAACQQIAKEVADTIIYGVLLASAVGEDLEAALIDVFNRKSEEYGVPERLGSVLEDAGSASIADARSSTPKGVDGRDRV